MDVTAILTTLGAVLVGVVSAARVTRLVTEDTWPPAQWVRSKWMELTGYGDWSEGIECPWCVAPWVVAASMAFAIFTDLHWSWWVLNGWMAASMAASWIAIKAGE